MFSCFGGNKSKKSKNKKTFKKIVVVPRILYEKHGPLLTQLLGQCKYPENQIVVRDPPYQFSPDDVLVVPCLMQSRVETDLEAAYQDAALQTVDEQDVIMVLFEPKAKHVREKLVPTMQQLGENKYKVKDIIDVIHEPGSGNIYASKTNKQAKDTMINYLK